MGAGEFSAAYTGIVEAQKVNQTINKAAKRRLEDHAYPSRPFQYQEPSGWQTEFASYGKTPMRWAWR